MVFERFKSCGGSKRGNAQKIQLSYFWSDFENFSFIGILMKIHVIIFQTDFWNLLWFLSYGSRTSKGPKPSVRLLWNFDIIFGIDYGGCAPNVWVKGAQIGEKWVCKKFPFPTNNGVWVVVDGLLWNFDIMFVTIKGRLVLILGVVAPLRLSKRGQKGEKWVIFKNHCRMFIFNAILMILSLLYSL